MTTRTLIITPALKNARHNAEGIVRAPEDRLAEAVSLAGAIDLTVVHAQVVMIPQVTPATYFGSGKAAELGEYIRAERIALAIVDAHLTPVQQRNLEKAMGCKVIDRTALILEIFGKRARTAEGKLQVDLAALEFQKSRLVRSWTHLERQRGGHGFLGGPGESQIESDRRQLQDQIIVIKGKLEKVRRMRELHRKKRRDVPYPIVALVGYTNAGKSTLFNRLTGAQVIAEDKLFATLDPTLRAIKLPSGRRIILSDTVGFISDLPTHLVAAFRATLEEVLEADVLLHVRDISHDESAHQKEDVLSVLKQLGVAGDVPVLEVWNKIDLVKLKEKENCHSGESLNPEPQGGDDARLPGIQASAGITETDAPIPLSALTGEGTDALLARIDALLSESGEIFSITLDAADGATLAWLYRHGEVLDRKAKGQKLHLQVLLSPENLQRFEKRQPHTAKRA
ncbi:MAG: GTPase HflX [Alphaproteobacteria bacterium]|nr:GTPase HflX [Alphaproteobacteria bacterium]